jgi:hypothetical protein
MRSYRFVVFLPDKSSVPLISYSVANSVPAMLSVKGEMLCLQLPSLIDR